MPNWRGVIDALQIRVLVLNIGDIPEETIHNYLNLLNDNSLIKCDELKPTSSSTGQGIFNKQIGGNSEIYLNFVLEKEIVTDLADFEILQLYRRVHAVIGIGISSNENFSDDYMKFLTKAQESSGNYVVRCFIFGDKRPKNITEKEAILLPDDDPDTLNNGIKQMLQELSVGIIQRFEAYAFEYSKKEIIESPRELDKKLLKDNYGRLRARTAGRIAKCMGDLLLLCGAYDEAVNNLVIACEETKSNGDLLWNAASQEALQIGLILQNEQILIDKKDSNYSLFWISLPDKLREVAPLYQKADLPLGTFEIHRTISKLLQHIGSSAEAAVALCHGWSVHRQLPFPDKLYALAMIIDQFTTLKMNRKRSFYLQALANLLNQQKEGKIALLTLVKTFPIYKINLEKVSLDGWMQLKCAILGKIVHLSEGHNSRLLLIEYSLALLAYSRSTLDSEEQLKIAQLLKKRQKNDWNSLICSDSTPIVGLLPIIERSSFCVDEIDAWWPKKNSSKFQENNSSFIYAPFSKQEISVNDQFAVATGAMVPISITINNPFAFPLELIGLKIIENEYFSCEEISLLLPAWTRRKELTLRCRTKLPGTFKVQNLEAFIFGVKTTLSIPNDGHLCLKVLPPQPVLEITGENLDFIHLFNGEESNLSLVISNLSNESAANLVRLKTFPEWEQNNEGINYFKDTLSAVKSDISTCSLAPKSMQQLNLQLLGSMGLYGSCYLYLDIFCRKSCKVTLIQEVEMDDEYYYNQIDHFIYFTVTEGPFIKEICALPYQNIKSQFGEGSPDGDSSSSDHRNGLSPPHLTKLTLTSDTNLIPSQNLNDQEYCLLSVDFCNPLSESIIIRIPRKMNKRLVFPVRRVSFKTNGNIQNSTFIEMTSQEGPSLISVKKEIFKNFSCRWSCSNSRNGKIDLVTAHFERYFLKFLRKRDIEIHVSSKDGLKFEGIHKIEIPLDIEIFVHSQSHLLSEPLVLRIIPVLHVSEDEFSIEYDEAICINGSLQSTFSASPSYEHHFQITALNCCRVKLMVYVENLSDHSIHTIPYPLLFDFSS